MKREEHTVQLGGLKTTTYATSIGDAVTLAKAQAIKQGVDKNPIWVEREDGERIYFCVVCHENIVDVEAGQDTCTQCM